MFREEVQLADMLLALKSKAAKSLMWTQGEESSINSCLEKEGTPRVLAACCILCSNHRRWYYQAVDVVAAALGLKEPDPYVELSVYEALIHVDLGDLASSYDKLFVFIDHSFTRRAINLDNTIYLLGRLARSGEKRALTLLHTLMHDSDVGIQNSVSLVLRGL
jgi:hypothetical protein